MCAIWESWFSTGQVKCLVTCPDRNIEINSEIVHHSEAPNEYLYDKNNIDCLTIDGSKNLSEKQMNNFHC